MQKVGSVAELRRYPVKSMAGEVLATARIERRGVVGDRRWAVTDSDGKFGSSKTTRRFQRMDGLLHLAASYAQDLTPVVAFPDGRLLAADDPHVDEALSDHVGRPVRLLAEADVSHFDEGPLHLVTTASIAAVAERQRAPVTTLRLRANLLVDVGAAEGLVEDAWVGRNLAIGDEVVVSIREPMPRCVMVEQSQKEVSAAPGLLGTIGRVNRACLGAVADVVRTGAVRLDDPVRLLA
ncbi:MOSC domain-containing protein [Egicoccus sp. AB-alg2]|uniref:MOSC domain-containing protein n=1 Tax=Egicoccus sp. AB-alg2 TaxID=3242693 RepID=UPI00359CD43C